MKVPTRFEIGQDVWFMKDNRVSHGYIYQLEKYSRTYSGGGMYHDYILWNLNSIGSFTEQELFNSKEELLKTL